jgi:hypothetical protein
MGMIIPAVMLVILAFVVIRALMGVVAHEDVVAPISLATEPKVEPPSPGGIWGDDARAFLLPAASEHIDLEQAADVDANAS